MTLSKIPQNIQAIIEDYQTADNSKLLNWVCLTEASTLTERVEFLKQHERDLSKQLKRLWIWGSIAYVFANGLLGLLMYGIMLRAAELHAPWPSIYLFLLIPLTLGGFAVFNFLERKRKKIRATGLARELRQLVPASERQLKELEEYASQHVSAKLWFDYVKTHAAREFLSIDEDVAAYVSRKEMASQRKAQLDAVFNFKSSPGLAETYQGPEELLAIAEKKGIDGNDGKWFPDFKEVLVHKTDQEIDTYVNKLTEEHERHWKSSQRIDTVVTGVNWVAVLLILVMVGYRVFTLSRAPLLFEQAVAVSAIVLMLGIFFLTYREMTPLTELDERAFACKDFTLLSTWDGTRVLELLERHVYVRQWHNHVVNVRKRRLRVWDLQVMKALAKLNK